MGNDSFPPAPGLPRRRFFRALAGELAVWVDEFKGRPQLRLSDLGKLPHHVLAEIRPVLNPAAPCMLDGDRLRGPGSPGSPGPEWHCFTPGQMLVLERCDGNHTLGEIGRLAGDALGLEQEASWALARGLFLGLAKLALLVPDSPHVEHRDLYDHD